MSDHNDSNSTETITSTEANHNTATVHTDDPAKQASRAAWDMGFAGIMLRIWVAVFCLLNGITKFQTDNPNGAGPEWVIDPAAWSGGIIEGKGPLPEGVDEQPEVEAVWTGALTQADKDQDKRIALGYRTAGLQHSYGGPFLNHSAWSADAEGKGFDLINTFTRILPWWFIGTGIAVLIGFTRRLSMASAALICVSLSFGLLSMGDASVEVIPLYIGFLPAVIGIAIARFQKLCILPWA